MAKKTITQDPWMSPNAAAPLLRRHRQTVLAMALRGELKSMQAGGNVFVLRADVERLAAELPAQDQAA